MNLCNINNQTFFHCINISQVHGLKLKISGLSEVFSILQGTFQVFRFKTFQMFYPYIQVAMFNVVSDLLRKPFMMWSCPEEPSDRWTLCKYSTVDKSLHEISHIMKNLLLTVLSSLSFVFVFDTIFAIKLCLLTMLSILTGNRQGSGSVIESLTRDREVVGLSLTCVTVLCPRARHINPS